MVVTKLLLITINSFGCYKLLLIQTCLQFVSVMIQSHKRSFEKDNWGFDVQYYHDKDKKQLRINLIYGYTLVHDIFSLTLYYKSRPYRSVCGLR